MEELIRVEEELSKDLFIAFTNKSIEYADLVDTIARKFKFTNTLEFINWQNALNEISIREQ